MGVVFGGILLENDLKLSLGGRKISRKAGNSAVILKIGNLRVWVVGQIACLVVTLFTWGDKLQIIGDKSKIIGDKNQNKAPKTD